MRNVCAEAIRPIGESIFINVPRNYVIFCELRMLPNQAKMAYLMYVKTLNKVIIERPQSLDRSRLALAIL